jgi:hypothetical protein
MINKFCTACETENPINLFSKNKRSKDGLAQYCKPCYRKRARNLKQRFQVSKNRANKKQVFWGLSFEEWRNFVSDTQCHYCDGAMPETGIGLDRKNNDIGYILENVASCCQECNRIKSDTLTYEEMLEVAKLIKRIRKGIS